MTEQGSPPYKSTEHQIEKSQHGGKRSGSGPKPIHTNPQVKERTKKLRATDSEWQRFLELCPDNSREAFIEILEALDR